MEFLLLGPVEVRAEEGPLPLAGRKQRALLALLLLNANTPVSPHRLVSALWGDETPATVSASLQNRISRLRKLLGAERVVKAPEGYLLRVAPDELDLHRFERLVEQARDADPLERAAKLRDALALWRGHALGDLADEPFAQIDAMRLDELRLAALEDRVEADLALGRHGAVIPELEALVGSHPLRERLRGQLILALYRAGRQADALEEYRATRRMLVEDLGLEPTPELRRLEQAILAHDDSVRNPAATVAADRSREHLEQPETRAPLARRRDRRRLVLLAIALGAVGIGTLALAVLRSPGTPSVRPNAVAILDLRSGEVMGSVDVGTVPGPLALGEGALWVANIGSETLSRIDPRTRRVVKTIRLGFAPGAVAAGEGAVWVADPLTGTVRRINPATNKPDRTLFIGAGGPSSMGMATGWGSLWVGNENDLTLSRLVAPEGEIVALIRDAPGKALAASRRHVWMLDAQRSRLWKIDPFTDAVLTTIAVGRGGSALAADERNVWITDLQEDAVWWVDAVTGRLRKSIPVGQDPRAVAVSDGAVWVANSLDGSVSRLDISSGAVETFPLGDKVGGIAVGNGAVWVAVD